MSAAVFFSAALSVESTRALKRMVTEDGMVQHISDGR